MLRLVHSSHLRLVAASEVRVRPTIPSGRRDVPLDRTLPGGFVLGRAPEKPRRRSLVGIDGGLSLPAVQPPRKSAAYEGRSA